MCLNMCIIHLLRVVIMSNVSFYIKWFRSVTEKLKRTPKIKRLEQSGQKVIEGKTKTVRQDVIE